MDPRIYLAFRFHTNFYHSYRGDTPDEQGFGKDIRIVRHIIEVLDRFNEEGVPVRGTWDIENAFSLGDIMPTHCPDLIEALQRRVREGQDEVEIMSYNNGLISAHTAAEFDAAISRAFSNSEGSGLFDRFDIARRIVRPQEMMYTPLHIKLYRHHGVDALSLYYSAITFNAFSNFIPPLSLVERYNPLTLAYPGIDETITLLPTYNHGDVADHLSLRRWVRQVRRQQLALEEPQDLLILIDADADDDFWWGYDWPIVRQVVVAAQGLEGLVASVADLDFLTFTTPYDYVQHHKPVGTVSIGQDTADGIFDGFASWAEKWSNHKLWTGIERSRILEHQARHLAEDTLSQEVATHLQAALEARLRALSTTHFGLACPLMNRARLRHAASLVTETFREAHSAFRRASAAAEQPTPRRIEHADITLANYIRGRSTETVTYLAKGASALVRIALSAPAGNAPLSVTDDQGKVVPSAVWTPLGAPHELREASFVATLGPQENRTYRLRFGEPEARRKTDGGVRWQPKARTLGSSLIKLSLDEHGNPIDLTAAGTSLKGDPLIATAVRYGRRRLTVPSWQETQIEVLGDGFLGAIHAVGAINIPTADQPISVKREILVVAGLPYLYVTTNIAYPKTPPHTRRKDVVRLLGRDFDNRWQEIMPCEIAPGLMDTPGMPLRVWKRNYLDHVSAFDLDYASFSENDELDAFNNAITAGWVAVSDQTHGLLVAQSADAATCFAFCPMRLHRVGDRASIHLNPFGTYFGKQMAYPTTETGLGQRIAILMAETLQSMAPSYNGRHERFSLLIAPYRGDAPPSAVQADAEAFCAPFAVLSTSDAVRPPAHRTWNTEGLID